MRRLILDDKTEGNGKNKYICEILRVIEAEKIQSFISHSKKPFSLFPSFSPQLPPQIFPILNRPHKPAEHEAQATENLHAGQEKSPHKDPLPFAQIENRNRRETCRPA
eukprot:Sdes_comp19294_c0_seq1m10349